MLRARTKVARRLRKQATESERLLWPALRQSFPGRRFRRQHPIGRYIVDFACPSQRLAIEIDGGQHARQEAEDSARTAEIEQRGYRLVRFWNHEVLQNLSGVLRGIELKLDENSLSALEGGEGGARVAGG